jgi:phage-related protein
MAGHSSVSADMIKSLSFKYKIKPKHLVHEYSPMVKIIYNIIKVRLSSDKELFKKLTDEIWEFRTLFNKTHYRLFAFWDKSEKTETIVISTHGLIKKTDKTPQGYLDRAERLRKKYFELKDKKK